MPKASQSSSQDDFNAWKIWIEDKASYILSFAVDESTAKEYVTYISDYVINYLYSSDSPQQQYPSPVVNNPELKDLISSLQNPPKEQLLLTNFPANPEKYKTQELNQAVINSLSSPEYVTEMHNEIISNAIDKAIEIRRLSKVNNHGLKMHTITDQEMFGTLQKLKKDLHERTIGKQALQKPEYEQREERISEYKQSQIHEFTPWGSLPEEVQKDLKAKELDKIENLRAQQDSLGKESNSISSDTSFENIYLSAAKDEFVMENPLRLSQEKKTALKAKVEQEQVTPVVLLKQGKTAEEHVGVSQISSKQEASRPLSKNPRINKHDLTSSVSALPTLTSYIPDSRQYPFAFLPKKDTTASNIKEPSKWEKERLRKIAQQADLKSGEKENFVYTGNVSTVEQGSTSKVKDLVGKFGGNKGNRGK